MHAAMRRKRYRREPPGNVMTSLTDLDSSWQQMNPVTGYQKLSMRLA